MQQAYREYYLDAAQTNVAIMLDLAVNVLGYDLKEFYDFFSVSSVARGIEYGDPTMLVGHSGAELAMEVLEGIGADETELYNVLNSSDALRFDRSPEYWLGWAVTYYQWQSGVSFLDIPKIIPIKDIRKMYGKYHEMDILHFTDRLEEIRITKITDSKLRQIRRLAGYTQKILAERTGVPLRTIQQYEQRQKDINKAQAVTVLSLAHELGVAPEDIME